MSLVYEIIQENLLFEINELEYLDTWCLPQFPVSLWTYFKIIRPKRILFSNCNYKNKYLILNKLKLDRNIPIVPRWRENLKEPSVNDLKWMIDRQLFWYCLFIFTNKFMNTTFMHLSIQLAQIRKFRIRHTFHILDNLGPAVEWSVLETLWQ